MGLSCIQCDRQGIWYSPEENERHILRCQRGHIAPTLCANESHTHCIYSYYKQGGAITITERRCGIAADITGCTIYKSTANSATRRLKMRRHLIGGANTDTPMSGAGHSIFGMLGFGSSGSDRGGGSSHSHSGNHRRRDATPLVVEVCTSGCTEDGCTSSAIAVRLSWSAILLLWATIWLTMLT